MTGSRFAAVVLAGGLSSRLPPLKPLLPVDGAPAVVRTAGAFRDVGVEPLVVIGFAAGELVPVLEAAGLRYTVNVDYEDGMYSSLRAGVRAAGTSLDWLFAQPADCPLVRGETLGQMMRATIDGRRGAAHARRASRRALVPAVRGRRGHPPLLSAGLLPAVLMSEPPGGLRGVLDGLGEGLEEVPVSDEGVLLDMDDADAYARIGEHAVLERLPDAHASEAFLRRRAARPAVVAHSRAVRDVVMRLARVANAEGLGFNLRLLEAAALTHDVARGQPGHAAQAAAWLETEGYHRVARVVRHHMSLPGPPADPPGETELLYLADKLVREQTVVTLEERERRTTERFSQDPQARAAAAARLAAAAAIARSLERLTGRPLADMLADPASVSAREG